MKILILLIISFCASANSNLIDLLKLKESNYTKVINLYSSLKKSALQDDRTSFCKTVNDNITLLEDIYQDDFKLNSALIEMNQDHTLQYAVKIKENSRSDLFSFLIYSDLCTEGRLSPASRHALSIERSITNTVLLKRSHLIFMEIYQGLK